MKWTDEQALDTNISRITLALEGLIEWTKATNPFGGEDENDPANLKNRPADPAFAMQQLIDMAQARRAPAAVRNNKNKRKRAQAYKGLKSNG